MTEDEFARYFDTVIGLLERHPLLVVLEREKRILSRAFAYLRVSARFVDGSTLQVTEFVDQRLHKVRYAYHYQESSGKVIFRYDNAPHHPELKNFPHHKHLGDTLQSALAPTLAQVLQEVGHTLRA